MKIGKLPTCPDDDCQVLILFKDGAITEGRFWKRSLNRFGPTKGGPHYIESYFSEPLGEFMGGLGCAKYPIESIESWLIVDKSIFEEP